MKRLALALGIALVVTNAWWLYVAVDRGVGAAYREQACTEQHEALGQALAVVRLGRGHRARTAIVDAARAALPGGGEPFDKEGETVVGRLAFRFDRDGALLDVRGP